MMRVLILTSGLGMGCASRCTALAEELLKGGSEVHFASWGAGSTFLRSYWRDQLDLTELEPYLCRSVLRALLFWPISYLRNTWAVSRLIRNWAPHVVVMDSDYHLVMVPRRCEIRVFLGQAHDVVVRAKRTVGFTAHECVQLFVREKLDAWVQRILADRVFVPCFNLKGFKWPKVQAVPLLVRSEFRGDSFSGTVVLGVPGGSGLDLSRFLEACRSRGAATFSGILRQENLKGVGEVVIQGGLSSVSEILASGRKSYVLPVRNHPEQILNALEIEMIGWGEFLDRPARLKSNGAAARTWTEHMKDLRFDGAEVVASELLRMMSQPMESLI